MQIRDKRIWITLSALGLLGIGLAVYLITRPSAADSYHKSALEALERRDFAQARRDLDQYLELRRDDLGALLLAAQTARRQGDFEAAQRHLQIYQQKNGSVTEVELENQLMRVQEGDLREADAVLVRYTAQPGLRDGNLMLEAVIEGKLRALEQAFVIGVDEAHLAKHLEDVKRAVELWASQGTHAADQVQVLVWRGWCDLLGKDFPKACTYLKEALRRDPDHFVARLKLSAAVALENPLEAEQHLEILRRRDPTNIPVRFSLATVYHGVGRLEEAAKLLDEMLESQPDDVQTLLERGKVAIDARQPAAAEMWLRRALTFAHTDADVHLTLSRALQRCGKDEEAKQLYDRFLQLSAEQNKRKDEAVPKSNDPGRR